MLEPADVVAASGAPLVDDVAVDCNFFICVKLL